MSPRNDVVVVIALAAAFALAPSPAQAQTIGDYSRAQRLLLENTMRQAAARSAGTTTSALAPAAAASTAVAPTPAQTASHGASLVPSSPAEVVQVTGAFAAEAASVVEVVVDATAYLLQAGQGVPGTSWRVESVGVERVVLSRRDGGGVGGGVGGSGPTRRVFSLPALR